jgi:hypothetical protein
VTDRSAKTEGERWALLFALLEEGRAEVRARIPLVEDCIAAALAAGDVASAREGRARLAQARAYLAQLESWLGPERGTRTGA